MYKMILAQDDLGKKQQGFQEEWQKLYIGIDCTSSCWQLGMWLLEGMNTYWIAIYSYVALCIYV